MLYKISENNSLFLPGNILERKSSNLEMLLIVNERANSFLKTLAK